MTNQLAKDIVTASRAHPGDLNDAYINFIGNTLGAFNEIDKTVTKENIKIVLNGFAISMILSYIYRLDLESETDTFLKDALVDDVSDLIWDDWLKKNVEQMEKRNQGKNVVPLKAIN